LIANDKTSYCKMPHREPETLDVHQVRRQVEQLKHELKNVKRIPTSRTLMDLVNYVKENQKYDPMINPTRTDNPWRRKPGSKCTVL